MKAIRILRLVVVLAILCLAAAAVIWWSNSEEPSRVTMRQAKVSELREMAQLCTLDIYEEVPVRASIGKRHLFAKVTLEGSVYFDLEKIEQREMGDTLVVTLPKPTVEIQESTEKDAYSVIDTWNDNFLASSNFTTAEENSIKGRVKRGAIAMIERKGYVARAESEAVENMKRLLTTLLQRPVIVEISKK